MDCLHSQWYAPMKRALDLSGKSPATGELYLRSVRQLVDYLRKEPEEAEEQEPERYLLFRRNDSRWKPATRTLPVVLTQHEVTRIPSCGGNRRPGAALSLSVRLSYRDQR